MRTRLFQVMLVGGLVLGAGCQHPCRQPNCPGPPGAIAPPPGTMVPPPPPAGQYLPATPPGGVFPPTPPAPLSQDTRFSPTPPWATPGWGSIEAAGVQLGQPEINPSGGTSGSVKLYSPDNENRKSNSSVAGSPSPALPTQSKPAASPFPVGIPQFAQARDRVSTGLRPMLDDGLDWLQANGYRTVLHVRQPGEENSADRKQVEKRGLKYITLEVSPESLSKQVVEEFGRVVGDSEGQPLFVYDRDGALTGALWYLHFRTVDGISDEAARVRAASLGLREEREGMHKAMWQAARQVSSQ